MKGEMLSLTMHAFCAYFGLLGLDATRTQYPSIEVAFPSRRSRALVLTLNLELSRRLVWLIKTSKRTFSLTRVNLELEDMATDTQTRHR